MIKRLIILMITAFSFTNSSSAQMFQLDTALISIDKKPITAWSISVDHEPKVLSKAWNKYLKSKYNISLSKKNKRREDPLYFAEGVLFPQITKEPLELFTRFSETNDGCDMKLFVTSYSSRKSNEQNAIQNITKDFITNYLQNYYNDEIKETGKAVKKLNAEIRKTEKLIKVSDNKLTKLKQLLTTEIKNRRYHERVLIDGLIIDGMFTPYNDEETVINNKIQNEKMRNGYLQDKHKNLVEKMNKRNNRLTQLLKNVK